MNTKWPADGNPRPRQSERLLRHQARLPDDAFGVGAVLPEETGKVLGRVEHRLETQVDEPRLAEAGLGADSGELSAQLADDRPGCTGRRDDAEIDAGERAAIAEF